MFQSRNRDAFRFKVGNYSLLNSLSMKFQSRNRDAFRFKFDLNKRSGMSFLTVSISESRCFSFQGTTDDP